MATGAGATRTPTSGSRTEAPADRDRVVLTTFHRAKGLQWPTVIVLGLGAGLMPIASAQTPAAIDEERRLLYVALTRSEEELWCSWFERQPVDRDRAGRSEPRSQPLAGADRAGDRRAREGGGTDGGGRGLRVASRSCAAGWPRALRAPTTTVGPVRSAARSTEVGWPSHVGTPGTAAQGRRREPTSSRARPIHADYTHDEALTTAPVVPLALVLPGSTDEVSEVLQLASEHGVPVVARGSGTGLSGAAVPVADGILLAFDRMKRIRRDRHREPGRRGASRA